VATARLTLRVDLGGDRAIGPGKIRLLEAIRDTGSITKAGIALGMSYRRAWLLVDDMNNCFREPVIAAQVGGSRGRRFDSLRQKTDRPVSRDRSRGALGDRCTAGGTRGRV
jgi:molybdate transport repressor ModE-like protein